MSVIEFPQKYPPVTETRIVDGRFQEFREGMGWFVNPREGETDEELANALD